MGMHTKSKVVSKGVFWAFASALALIAVSCATVDAVTGQRVYNVYSLQDDIAMGYKTMEANTSEMKKSRVPINEDRAKLGEIQEIVRRIGAVSDLPQLPYNVTLYQTNIVNAAAAPGGSMMVFQGLYDDQVGMVKDNDELAAVMGHEIAHVTCRHVTERLTKITVAASLAEIAAQIASHKDNDDLATGIRAAFAVGTALWIPAYSRKDEAEADKVGMMYMARAGYDPSAAPRIWKRVAEKSGKKDPASIFATHPSDWDRYQNLNKLLPAAMQEYHKATGKPPANFTAPAGG